MAEMTREERFKAAAAQRKAEKEKEAQRGQGSFFEEIAYVALENGKDKIIRLLGNPADARVTPTDPKKIMISMIVGDDDKKFRCIWPNKSDNENWILHRIYGLVTAYTWDKQAQARNYLHRTAHPSLFNRVTKNGNVDNAYETGWRPDQMVIMNAIDRSDMAWHQGQKHTKILSKKMDVKDTSVWFDPGVPAYLYKMIWDDVVEYYGDWEGYDMAIRKDSASPYYRALNAGHDIIKVTEGVRNLIVEGPLTEEEAGWERYDLDTLFPITSYSKLLKKLGMTIKQIDTAFGKKYHEELSDLAADEERTKEASKPAASKAPAQEAPAQQTPAAATPAPAAPQAAPATPAPAVRTPRVPAAQANPTPAPSIDWVKAQETFEGIAKLTEEEKAMVTGIDLDTGDWKFLDSAGQMGECQECHFMAPMNYHACPNCGAEF